MSELGVALEKKNKQLLLLRLFFGEGGIDEVSVVCFKCSVLPFQYRSISLGKKKTNLGRKALFSVKVVFTTSK